MPSDDTADGADETNEVADEAFYQELEQIQTIIERQADNSFKIKGWAITLVVVVILFRANDIQSLIGFIPLIAFWYLDAYFLREEKKYRKLYDWVRQNRPENDNHLFDMSVSRFENKTDKTHQIMLSKTLRWFYGMIGVLLVLFFIIAAYFGGNCIGLGSYVLH